MDRSKLTSKRLVIKWSDEFGDHVHYITFETQKKKTKLTTRMLNAARGFKTAGDRCIKEESVGNNRTVSLTVPSIVNYMFSIEIFLKAFCELKGNSYKNTHELKKIWESLDPSTKEEIKGKFEENFNSIKTMLSPMRNSFHGQEAALEEELGNFNSILSLDFLTFMDKASNFFVKARYTYENEIEANFLDIPITVLVTVLYKISDRLLEENSPTTGN